MQVRVLTLPLTAETLVVDRMLQSSSCTAVHPGVPAMDTGEEDAVAVC